MQKVLTAAEMREVDRLTTEKYGIPSIILMENAAHAVARVITEKLGGSVKDKSILILCGKGNNGGDGAALARILWQNGAEIYGCLLGEEKDVKGDARKNLGILKALSEGDFDYKREAEIFYEEISTASKWEAFLNKYFDYSEPDAIVDAIFGTGLTRPLAGIYENIARWVRGLNVAGVKQDSLVFSIDVPSGLDADGTYWIGQSLRANATIAFTAPKPANILPPVHDFSGEVVVANIGSPQGLIDDQPSQLYLAEREDAARWLKRSEFSSDSYKNKRGHALVVAGSESYSGAAVLAGNAAMRSGVGLVTLLTPRSSKESVAARVLPEVMVRGAAETGNGAIAEEALEEAGDLFEKAAAIAVGSGLSQNESTKRFVQRVIENRWQPVILDADALNLLSPFSERVSGPDLGKEASPLILTPHEGEFLRMLGTDDREAIKDRVAAVREFSQQHNVVLVLKGERVLIGEPGGRVVVNPTGNSGLGKAGNGDTLTGILTGFAAQAAKMTIDIFETVVAAVYVAGMAGDIAERKYGKRVMSASDVRECLTEAFDQLEAG
jgi:NAD(P)H-hydrate epimerase